MMNLKNVKHDLYNCSQQVRDGLRLLECEDLTEDEKREVFNQLEIKCSQIGPLWDSFKSLYKQEAESQA